MAMSFISHPQGLDSIPNFVSARTPRRLRREMLINNTKQGGFVKYQNIQWNPTDKRWYAWYFVKVEDELITNPGAE